MAQITLDIKDINKLSFFTELIKNLDFVSIKEISNIEENELTYSLTNEQIDIIKERKQKHFNAKSKSYSWEEIKKDLDNK